MLPAFASHCREPVVLAMVLAMVLDANFYKMGPLPIQMVAVPFWAVNAYF
jgi:hypothetical protein